MSLDRAQRQDIRELHIGLLNMMPDAALSATEQQFIRLVGSSNQIAQFYVYPFSLPELNRGEPANAHIDEHYFNFDSLQEAGLDALIITGANVANPSLEQEDFWSPLIEVVRWAERQCRLDPVFLPRDARVAAIPSRYSACSSATETLGRIQPSCRTCPIIRWCVTSTHASMHRIRDTTKSTGISAKAQT